MKFVELLLLASPIYAVESNLEPEGGATNRYFKFGANLMPHPEKLYRGGEDAMLASDSLLVVADGVGGWADHGVDPGVYSKQLVSDFKSLYDTDNSQELL